MKFLNNKLYYLEDDPRQRQSKRGIYFSRMDYPSDEGEFTDFINRGEIIQLKIKRDLNGN